MGLLLKIAPDRFKVQALFRFGVPGRLRGMMPIPLPIPKMIVSHPPILGTDPTGSAPHAHRPEHHLEWRWADEAACARCAQAVAQAMSLNPALANAVITLEGDLGAGKTTFARHLLQALGVQGRIKSPTYAVMESHRGRAGDHDLAIAHFDFYRFQDPQEWEDAGLRDVFSEPGLKLCEWPQQVADRLAVVDLALQLFPEGETGRRVQGQAHSACGRALLHAAAQP